MILRVLLVILEYAAVLQPTWQLQVLDVVFQRRSAIEVTTSGSSCFGCRVIRQTCSRFKY